MVPTRKANSMKHNRKGTSDFGKLLNAFTVGGPRILTHASAVAKCQQTVATEAEHLSDELFQALMGGQMDLIDERDERAANVLYKDMEERIAGCIAALQAAKRGNRAVMYARFPDSMMQKEPFSH